MRARRISQFLRDEAGAVASTYALALVGLIVVGGVAFDYGRLAAMDSELQNGADQAALAGATQLDGKSGACARAASRAIDLVTNNTRSASSANTITMTTAANCTGSASIRFWQDRNRATAASTDANARFIEVIVDQRTANYAFTPISGLLVGNAQAAAMAGLGTSICKVPPVFMCNPDEATDPNFTIANYIGKGIRLVANDGGGNYGSGNFGYLQTNAGSGASAISDVLGKVNIPGDCVAADGVTTKPGANVSVLDALNTRFDIYTGNTNAPCGNDGAACPPSANTRKDLVHKGGTNNCAYTTGGGNGWQLPDNPYAPTTATAYSTTDADNLAPMGYPRDMCHSTGGTGVCAKGAIGDGNWDRNAYFVSNDANYDNAFDVAGTFGTATPTRYQVYKWEAANAATRLQNDSGGSAGPGNTARSQPYCTTPGIPVGTVSVDRRVLSVAVINCGAGLNGTSGPHTPAKWIDVFLVEPSVRRRIGSTTYTENSDVYVEVIGETRLGGGGSTAAQLIRRDVPYLVR